MKKLLIIASIFMLMITFFADFAMAGGTSEGFMRIGRFWYTAGYDGAEGFSSQCGWPGGRFADHHWDSWNVKKFGSVAGVKNWEAPNGKTYSYWTSGAHRTHDYEYKPYWKEQTNLMQVLPVDMIIYQRWEQPNVFVNDKNIIADGGDDFLKAHKNTEVDPNLITERAIKSIWRYTMGAELVEWLYGYSTPVHQDYVLKDFTITNNGKVYGHEPFDPEQWPHPEWKHILEGQKLQDFWWESNVQARVSNMGDAFSFGSRDAVGEFFTPLAAEGNNVPMFLFYDGDHVGDGVKDWGDPSQDDRWVELLSPAYLALGTLYADKSASDHTNDPTEPHSTSVVEERYNDLGKTYLTMQAQYDAIFQAGSYWPLETPASEINPSIQRPCAYQCYGPYNLNFNDSIHIIQVMAANGISQKLCQKYGVLAKQANFTGPIMDEIEALVKTGRDSLIKTIKAANWNVNGDKGGKGKYDVPDAPRPPANFWVASDGARIKLTWSDESRDDKDFDTGVKDFAGYRVYRAIGRNDSLYHLVYDGTNNLYYDEDVTTGFQYFYYLVAYDDGTQNWENPGVSLESGRFYCWTGWAPTGVSPASAPITTKSGMENIRVVPNPYSPAGKTYPGVVDQIVFTGLPPECTITIFTTNGDFVHKIEHTDGSGTEKWNLRTEFNQYVVSDVYIYTVKSDLGEFLDKFIIIR
ncbi:MAG: hypothetical protein GXO75_14250 [Calditrichaeota bacterium]|nr:hypothetical protein [Calditrichota bacterium]